MATLQDGWHRLHPLTILKELGSLAWALLAALVLDLDFAPVPEQVASTEALLALAVFGYAVVRYLFTAYRLTDQALELRRGVVVKSFQSMPRDRIQSVGATTSLVGRFVGITTVEVSAADAEDIRLGFVSESASASLRSLLAPERVPTDEGATEDEAMPEQLASLDVGRLLVFGLTETGLIPAATVFAISIFLAFALGVVAAPLGAASLAAWPVMKTVGLAGFRSWIENDRVHIEGGVLGRRQTESPLQRIQTLQVRRPPLRRLFGLETVAIVTGDIAVSSEHAVTAGTVAPLETIGDWRRIAEALIGRVAIGEPHLERSSPLMIRRTLLRGAVVTLFPAVVAGVLSRRWWVGLVILAAGAAIMWVYARARWRILGWAHDERHLMVRRGVVARQLSVVPVEKVQDVTVRQTFFQRRLGIATVEVDTAGVTLAGSIKAIDLELPTAHGLAKRLSVTAARIALPDGV